MTETYTIFVITENTKKRNITGKVKTKSVFVIKIIDKQVKAKK